MDYNAIAKQYGAVSSVNSSGKKVDYASLAKQFNAVNPAEAPASPKRATGIPGFLEDVTAGLLKTPARLATNLINAGQIATGNKQTQPFSGDFLGEVKPVGNSGNIGQDLKDSLGAGAELASYVAGAPEIAEGANALKTGKLLANPTLSTLYNGGKALAPAFALQSGGQSLQDPDKGLGRNLVDTFKGGVTGFGVGAGLGAGGALLEKTGLPEKVFGNSAERSANAKIGLANDAEDIYQKHLDMTRDVNTDGITTQNGKKVLTGTGDAARYRSGNASDTSLFKGSQPGTTLEEEARAKSTFPYLKNSDGTFIDPVKNPEKAIGKLNQAGNEFANNKMNPFLDNNKNPINFQEINDYMNSGAKPKGFGRDPVADKTYQDTIDDVVDILKKETNSGRDIYSTKDINNARKSIDDLIRKQEGENALDSSRLKGVSAAGKYARDRVNQLTEDMIKYGKSDPFAITKINQAEKDLQAFGERPARTEGTSYQQKKNALYENRGLKSTPEGEKAAIQFRRNLAHQKNIIESTNNIAIRAAENKGKSLFTQTLEKHPIIKKIAKVGTGAALVGEGLKSLYK